MRVHVFKLSGSEKAGPLSTTLELIERLSLEQRMRSVGFKNMRLESVTPPNAACSLWLLDFCKLRNQGPGKASPRSASTSFNLAAEERFSEETAAVFDPLSGYMAVQYNHYGPRSASIASYLSLFLDPGQSYELQIKLDPSVQARLNKKVQFTGFGFRVAPDKLSAEWKKHNVGMYEALKKQQDTYGGDWISVEISLEPHSHGTLKLKEKVKGFLGFANEPEAVTKVEVRGRDGLDEKIDVVDLLSGKLEKVYKGLPLDAGLRVSAAERWVRLLDAINHWKATNVI